MNIINIEHLTHSFTERLLFDDVSFYLSDKDKVGVIGINGTGKSTLLKIIAGKETADRADIIMQRDLRIAYLPQIPEFADTHTTLSVRFRSQKRSVISRKTIFHRQSPCCISSALQDMTNRSQNCQADSANALLWYELC